MIPIDSSKSRKSFTDLLVHVHPPTVPEETLRFNLSYGLGGMSATLILLLFATGVIQLLTYEPSASMSSRAAPKLAIGTWT